MAVALALAACGSATAPNGARSTVTVLDLDIERNIAAGSTFRVRVPTFIRGGPVRITDACFLRSGDGPFCVAFLVAKQRGQTFVETNLRTFRSDVYLLEVYLDYESSDGITYQTNRVARRIFVGPPEPAAP